MLKDNKAKIKKKRRIVVFIFVKWSKICLTDILLLGGIVNIKYANNLFV